MSDGVMETWFNQVGVTDYLGDYQAEALAWAGGIDETNSPDSHAMTGTHESQNSHPAIGLQATRNGSIGSNTEVNNLRTLANDFADIGMIVKGIYQGERRGFYYLGSNTYQSDSAGQTVTHNQLLTAAGSGEPLTWMLVHQEIEERAGVDRNSNGIYDYEERMRLRMKGHVGRTF